MKKFSITLLLGLASLMFVMNGCKRVNCTELMSAYISTGVEYAFDPSVANCKAYADAIEDYMDKCTVANKAELEDILDDLDCGK